MPFYVDKDGESYLAYLERLEQCYPDREPLEYDRFLELQSEFDRYYTPAFEDFKNEGHLVTHPALSRLKLLEDRLAI